MWNFLDSICDTCFGGFFPFLFFSSFVNFRKKVCAILFSVSIFLYFLGLKFFGINFSVFFCCCYYCSNQYCLTVSFTHFSSLFYTNSSVFFFFSRERERKHEFSNIVNDLINFWHIFSVAFFVSFSSLLRYLNLMIEPICHLSLSFFLVTKFFSLFFNDISPSFFWWQHYSLFFFNDVSLSLFFFTKRVFVLIDCWEKENKKKKENENSVTRKNWFDFF